MHTVVPLVVLEQAYAISIERGLRDDNALDEHDMWQDLFKKLQENKEVRSAVLDRFEGLKRTNLEQMQRRKGEDAARQRSRSARARRRNRGSRGGTPQGSSPAEGGRSGQNGPRKHPWLQVG